MEDLKDICPASWFDKDGNPVKRKGVSRPNPVCYDEVGPMPSQEDQEKFIQWWATVQALWREEKGGK